MARLGRAMRNDAMIERVAIERTQRRSRSRAGVAIEQHRHARHARRDDRTDHRGELAPTETAQEIEAVLGLRLVELHPSLDHGDLTLETFAGDAGARPDP